MVAPSLTTWVYADDLCIFSPSVSGLRKLMHCCEKYGDIFNITYNVNKSYCMVIDNKSQNMKYTHPVTLNNNVLPYSDTTKCKYLGHIINNNLTDDDDIARQKIYFYAHANVSARKFRFCSSGIKNVLFHSYCGAMYTSSLWCKFKKFEVLMLHTTIVLESYISCQHAVVLVLCSFLTTSNRLMNLLAHLYLVCCAVYKILRIHFL